MRINLKETPFSAYGSYFAISFPDHQRPYLEGLYLKTVHGGAMCQEFFKIDLLNGSNPVAYTETATPTLLRLEAENGFVEMCIYQPDSVRIRGEGAGLRLTKYDPGAYEYAIPVEDGMWEINATIDKLRLIPVSGGILMNAPWVESRCTSISVDLVPDESTSHFECIVEEFKNAWKAHEYPQSFEECLQMAEGSYKDWLDKTLAVPEAYSGARELAAYLNWSSVVKPEGHIKRPAMLMSKNWMASVWSWDHCFNAMALVKLNPEAAWDQYMFMVDHQDEHGAFPDCVNDKTMIWNFLKPPIHGWVLDWMMKRSDFITADRLAEVYGPLCRWTNYWFEFMDSDRDGIPQYNHGNDSGWDNSTIFRSGTPLESPDLCTFLILQMEVLSKAAAILGKKEESGKWLDDSRELTEKMLGHFYRDNVLTAVLSGSHEAVPSDSLILFLPLLLGERLPKDLVNSLVQDLKTRSRFQTAYGFATEAPSSPFYTADGYWRGPIWAPPTLILVEALAQLGEKELAVDIAGRFCDMAARNGMAENFNALTGEALRDKAYTWTSSIFLILANEFRSEGR